MWTSYPNKIGRLLFCLPILVGCTALNPYGTRSHEGPPIPPKISYEYTQMSTVEIEKTLKHLIDYQRILDQYIESISETLLDKEYVSLDDRLHFCQASTYIHEIELPPKPKIKDDGRDTDDEIILKLVTYIKSLTEKITGHNKRVVLLRQEYNRLCLTKRPLR